MFQHGAPFIYYIQRTGVQGLALRLALNADFESGLPVHALAPSVWLDVGKNGTFSSQVSYR